MKEKLTQLIDVKSLITLGMVFSYIVFTAITMFTKAQIAAEYTGMVNLIIGSYFGYKVGQKSVVDNNTKA